MGSGTIRLMGHKRRPWLELKRCESERRYLSHQLRQLRAAHDGPLEVVFSSVPTEGFYDLRRLRIRSDALHHAYALLYPRDERRISPQVLDIAGIHGLAALWIDRGRWHRNLPHYDLRGDLEDSEALLDALQKQQINARLHLRDTPRLRVQIDADSISAFGKLLRPYVHTVMRYKLWPPKTLN